MKILGWPAFKHNGLNPYTALLYTSMQSLGVEVEDYSVVRAFTGRYEVFHIHWPEYYIGQRSLLKAFLGTLLLFTSVWLQRILGARVFWTVHNLQCHNQTRPVLEKYFWSIFVRSIDGYICLTEQGKRKAEEKWPRLRAISGTVVAHGHYRDQYQNTVSRRDACVKLKIPDGTRVILFFGAIGPYKNVPNLIHVFRKAFREDENRVLLLIAGIPQESEVKRLFEQAGDDPRIRLHLRRIAEEEVQLFFNASDLVVLPFSEILNSGSAILSLSFNRPVLVPAQGAMPELRDVVGERWVQMYSEDLGPEILRDSLEWAAMPRTHADLHDLSWPAIAEKTLNAYYSMRTNGGEIADLREAK